MSVDNPNGQLGELIQSLSDRLHDLNCILERMTELERMAKENSARLARIELWLRNPRQAAQQVLRDDQAEHETVVRTFGCPVCRGQMVARMGGVMKIWFAGCANYPKCRGSRSMNGVDTTPKPKREYVLDHTKTLHESSAHSPSRMPTYEEPPSTR